ncbi:hypothetical protein K439DRAFT_1623958 [Ramaria rubella]|nr:hypothetical protein K439DRAFT_1623958 [Ramaria rubella]
MAHYGSTLWHKPEEKEEEGDDPWQDAILNSYSSNSLHQSPFNTAPFNFPSMHSQIYQSQNSGAMYAASINYSSSQDGYNVDHPFESSGSGEAYYYSSPTPTYHDSRYEKYSSGSSYNTTQHDDNTNYSFYQSESQSNSHATPASEYDYASTALPSSSSFSTEEPQGSHTLERLPASDPGVVDTYLMRLTVSGVKKWACRYPGCEEAGMSSWRNKDAARNHVYKHLNETKLFRCIEWYVLFVTELTDPGYG